MRVNTCNKCKRPINNEKYFNFDIKCYNSVGMFIQDVFYINDPEIQLNDFCLCENCMKKFSEFIKE